MTGWSISPSGVQGVLQRTQEKAESLSTALDGIEGHVTAAVTGSGESQLVGGTIGEFFENRSAALQSIGDRVGAGLTGASNAVGWYLRGDEEMAAEQQQLAASVAQDGQFGRFTAPPEG